MGRLTAPSSSCREPKCRLPDTRASGPGQQTRARLGGRTQCHRGGQPSRRRPSAGGRGCLSLHTPGPAGTVLSGGPAGRKSPADASPRGACGPRTGGVRCTVPARHSLEPTPWGTVLAAQCRAPGALPHQCPPRRGHRTPSCLRSPWPAAQCRRSPERPPCLWRSECCAPPTSCSERASQSLSGF